MMLQTIFTKTIYDKRIFIVGWFFGFVTLAALLVAFFPSMRQEGSFEVFVQSMPPAMQGFIGDLANLSQFSTYLASQLFDIRMQIIGGVMVVVLAIGLTIADEEKGQLRTISALPVSRTSLMLQKWLAMMTIIGLALLGTAVGVYATQFTIGESVALSALAQLMVMTWLVMATFATITFAVAMGTGSRALTTLFSILLLAGSFVLTTFSVGVEWLQPYESLSLFYYFPAVDIVKNGIEIKDVLVLCGLSAVSLVVSLVGFRRRDIQ